MLEHNETNESNGEYLSSAEAYRRGHLALLRGVSPGQWYMDLDIVRAIQDFAATIGVPQNEVMNAIIRCLITVVEQTSQTNPEAILLSAGPAAEIVFQGPAWLSRNESDGWTLLRPRAGVVVKTINPPSAPN